MKEEKFYTLKGYSLQKSGAVTGAMEDYLEMICRLARSGVSARVGLLAAKLHVRPSSASKMVGQLRRLGLVAFEPYGAAVIPTPRGRELGEYLLWRHHLLHRFFCRVNGTENELELVEKIEHFLDRRTLENLCQLTRRLFPEEDCNAPPPLL
ncbi:MAG: metal-dependent transcriptional regulator [Oscillospiraceae bacterium]|nr:metal-dependent transcriptional regulator [Oscillospiraceae bacterium]